MANIFDDNSGTAGPGGYAHNGGGGYYGGYYGGGGAGYHPPNDSTPLGSGPGPFGAPTTGFPGQTTAQPTPAPPSSTPASTTANAPNYGWLMGYDWNKLMDPSHTTAKYQIGRTLAQYNPSGGFSDAVLNALNALGLGHFSGQGDQLSLSGVTPQGLQAGLDPHDFTGDFIFNWTGADPNDHSGARWTYDAYADPFTAAATNPQAFTFPTMPTMPPPMDWASFFAGMGNFAQPTQQAPAPTPAPNNVAVPRGTPQMPAFTGGYVQPGYGSSAAGGVGSATQTLASTLPQLMNDPRYANDPLIRQLVSLIGGYQ